MRKFSRTIAVQQGNVSQSKKEDVKPKSMPEGHSFVCHFYHFYRAKKERVPTFVTCSHVYLYCPYCQNIRMRLPDFKKQGKYLDIKERDEDNKT